MYNPDALSRAPGENAPERRISAPDASGRRNEGSHSIPSPEAAADASSSPLRRAMSLVPGARFEREAKLLASLKHPNIATVHGSGEFDGRRLLILELPEGETRAARIGRGSEPDPDPRHGPAAARDPRDPGLDRPVREIGLVDPDP